MTSAQKELRKIKLLEEQLEGQARLKVWEHSKEPDFIKKRDSQMFIKCWL